MTHRLNLALVLLALLLGVPYFWYFLDNSVSRQVEHRLDLAELRQLAGSIPGTAPSAVEAECSAFRRVPGNLMVAGAGIKRKSVCYMAFRLPVAGGRPIMIESGISAKIAEAIGVEKFFAPTQQRIEDALDQAGVVLVTHEHPDHLGALVAHGGSALAKAAMLNPRQLPPAPQAAKLAWQAGAIPQPRISGERPQAVAPGVVVIPAPNSHTPGSQMVFVRLADGREFLFAGDLSSFAQNWMEQRGRSRFVETWIAPQDRDEVFGWLRAIWKLKQSDSRLTIVPGHDFEWLQTPENASGVQIGFTRW